MDHIEANQPHEQSSIYSKDSVGHKPYDHNDHARYLLYRGHHEKSEHFFQEVLSLDCSLPFKAQAYIGIGKLRRSTDREPFEQAIELIRKHTPSGLRSADKKPWADAYIGLGIFTKMQGHDRFYENKWSEAKGHYIDALRFLESARIVVKDDAKRNAEIGQQRTAINKQLSCIHDKEDALAR
jgi:tetratricopeptide (TPR) repeat protein